MMVSHSKQHSNQVSEKDEEQIHNVHTYTSAKP